MYIRRCAIVAQAAGGQTLDLSALRCRFEIIQHSRQGPDKAVIKITNQAPATARQFVTPNAEFTNITISAGYEDGAYGVIFSGGIVQGIYGREDPTTTLTTIVATTAHQASGYGYVNVTLPAGSTPKDHLNVAIQAMSKYGVGLGFIGPSIDLTTPRYPRAVTLYGMARDVLYNIARSKNADLCYTKNYKVQMTGPSDSAPGGPVVLNSTTGMVGMPTQEIGGIMVRSLINNNIVVGGLIQINQADIQRLQLATDALGNNIVSSNDPNLAGIAADGIYKVFQINYSGDTRGQPWYMDIAALIPGKQTNASLDAGVGGS